MTENGVFACDGQVAHQVKHMAATDGVAVYHSDNWLRQAANLHLHVEHIEAWHTVFAHIAATALHIHVATATECHVASTGENHHADAACLTAVGKRLAHFPSGARGERIAITRAVDSDFRYTVIFFKEDFLKVESFNFFPFSHNLKLL